MNQVKGLSILIPARNEMFLARTVQDILENIQGDTEIIVGLDGQWADPPVIQHDRVTVVYYPQSIGQRAMTNQLCKLSQAKYVMKTDAHVAFDKGFDVKMMQAMAGHDDWTMIPTMKNLHVFDWVCNKCNVREYQGQTHPCPKCGGAMERDMVWKPRRGVSSNFYRFDNTLHFQYWKDFENRPEAQGNLAPTMCIQGSCFMLTRDKYWELNISDEKHGSWGQQGVEVACKTWLSGGQVMVNKDTWYAHLFRTQGGDFGFPYPNPGISKAREFSRDLWFSPMEELKKKFPPAIHDLQWLLDKFSPIPDWDVSKGILYYSDGELDEKILKKCQDQIVKGANGRRIVSVTLKKMDFGDNIHLPLPRGYVTMAKQILAGLKELQSDVVFFTEHDVLYHPSHFNFVPSEKDKYYYNVNVWRTRFDDGHSIKTDDCRQLSGLCAYRSLLIEHYEKRVKLLEEAEKTMTAEEFNKYVRNMGFEPGTHNRSERVDDHKSDKWNSAMPNVDIRHGKNLTSSRWKKEQFRNQKYTVGWQETKDIPGWGLFKDIWN